MRGPIVSQPWLLIQITWGAFCEILMPCPPPFGGPCGRCVSQRRDPTNHSLLPTCTGTHSTQRMFGCDVQEDGRSGSFWQFGFDGQDHLILDLETLSWVSAVPMALRSKPWWESEPCYAEYDKVYLESLCLTSLRRYLDLGGQHLTRRGKAQPVAMQRVAPCSHSQDCPM